MPPDVSDWISDPTELATRLAAAAPRVGMDTEFVRERTWWPKLALVQIALEDGSILLVDPLVPGMNAVLAALLADPAVTKVMHSPSEDLMAFKHACGVVPAPLFDTQAAAALAGVAGGAGYQRLVQDMLGVALPKGETRSDWMRRPLSAAQLEYAADDVRYLFALHDDLDARLQALGRRDWLAADSARMVDNASNDELESWPHLAIRSDKPRGWILDNELAAALARRPPADRNALQQQLESTPKAPRTLGDAIWQALDTPLDDEDVAPLARADDRDKALMRKLQDAVAALGAELGLPDGMLASRRWLQLLVDAWAEGRRDDWPGPLAGWRRGLLEPRLAPLLDKDAGGRPAPSV